MGLDPRGISRHALQTFSGTAAFGVAGLLNVLIAAAFLGAAAYGQLTLALAMAVLASSIGVLALPSLVTRECARQSQSSNRITVSSLTLSLILAIVGFGVLIAWGLMTGSLAPILSDSGSAVLLVAALVYSLSTIINTFLLARLQGLGAFSNYRNLLLLRSIGLVLPVVAAMTSRNVTLVLTATAVAELLTCLVFFKTTLDRTGGSPRLDIMEARRMLRIAWKPGLASQSIALSTWLGLVWVSQQSEGLVYAGWFGLSQKLANGAALMGLAFVTAGSPRLHAEGARDGTARSALRGVLPGAGLLALLGGMLLLLAAPLAPLLGAEYQGSELTLRIMALAVPLIVINALLSTRALAVNALATWYASDFLLAGSFLLTATLLISPRLVLALPLAVVVSFSCSICLLLLVGPWKPRP